ncbi:SLBB domain-containing protein [Candidatus Marinimicrobia bacterium]|nr:SLBB domain-containing protein [Candidatus Neomarinimicrobiota bacterium]MDA9656447.1 SLBB domain-containing protein [Candidatus Neomarinimicrobiota bacterium]
MKKIIAVALIIQSVPYFQTLDINSLRLAQRQISKSTPQLNNNTSSMSKEKPFLIDKSISPKQYKVGPGDQIHINIISSNETFDYSLVISPTGELLIPSVGLINTNKLNLYELIKEIKNKIKSWNSNAQVNIELEGVRKFKVLVTGQFDNAGYFVATPITRVSDLYENILQNYFEEKKNNYSQSNSKTHSETIGIQSRIAVDDLYKRKMGVYQEEDSQIQLLSKRNILIYRELDTLEVDIECFKVTGNISMNPYIEQGDVIQIPYIESYFYINGGVQRPGRYEFKKDETLEEVIEIAGGLKSNIKKDNIRVIHSEMLKEKPKILQLINDKNFKIRPEDNIMIPFSNNKKPNDIIEITGEIKFPGTYSIVPGETTLGDLIDISGGFTEIADTNKVLFNNSKISEIPDRELERVLLKTELNRSIEEKAYIKARVRTQKGSLETSLQEVIEDQNIIVAHDQIHIPKYFPYVEVIGAVNFPGRYPYSVNKTTSDFIEMAGGIIRNKSGKKFLVKSTTSQRIKLNNRQKLSSGDIIFIAEKLEYNQWFAAKEIVTAIGQLATIVLVIQRILETN